MRYCEKIDLSKKRRFKHKVNRSCFYGISHEARNRIAIRAIRAKIMQAMSFCGSPKADCESHCVVQNAPTQSVGAFCTTGTPGAIRTHDT